MAEIGPDLQDVVHLEWLAKNAAAHPYPCVVREKRRTMNDEEFWADVFPSPEPDPFDEDGELEKCLGIDASPPCPECGSTVACGYDSEGRPMIHVVAEDNE